MFFKKEIFRFLTINLINTILSYSVYLILLLFYNYNIAYSISFACGILISFYLNTIFVFRQEFTLVKFFQFPLVYVMQYILGISLLQLVVKKVDIQEVFFPFIVILFSLPINFIFTRFLFKRK